MREIKRIIKLLADVVNASDMTDESIVLSPINPGLPNITKSDVLGAVEELKELEALAEKAAKDLKPAKVKK